MPTTKQEIGDFGELIVIKKCHCPKCKRIGTLKRLRVNFKCADVICDFCGFLAQVKTASVKCTDQLPKQLLGGAWNVQDERMKAGIYMPLFIVLKQSDDNCSIYYLSSDIQIPSMFKPRKPLSSNAKRSGWQGYIIDLSLIPEGIVKLI